MIENIDTKNNARVKRILIIVLIIAPLFQKVNIITAIDKINR